MNAVAKDPRQEKGLVLAQAKRIKQIAGNTFYVPSAVDKGGYVVDTQKGTCTCPDFELRTLKCKHQWAISYARHEVTAADGSKIVTETMRVTYTQNWPRLQRWPNARRRSAYRNYCVLFVRAFSSRLTAVVAALVCHWLT